MNDDQILLYTIAEILLEVNLTEEKKERLRHAMCGVYIGKPPTKSKGLKFEIPTVTEVRIHMDNLKVMNTDKHSTEFWHFYESKGWMVGKNRMKNWKSAATRWCIDLPRGGDSEKRRVVV
jgi:hypothetical protein